MSQRNIACPDRSGQAVKGVVGSLDHVLLVVKGQHAQDRAKDLVGGDRHLIADVVKDRRCHKVAFIANSFTTSHALGTFALALVDVRHDLVELGLVDLWSLLGVRGEGVADFSILGQFLKLREELVVLTALDKHAATGATTLALVQEQADIRPHRGSVQVGVGENHVWTLPAQLEGQSFERISGLACDDLGRAMLAGECDLVDQRMFDNRGTGRRSISRNHVDDSVRDTDVLSNLRHPQAG